MRNHFALYLAWKTLIEIIGTVFMCIVLPFGLIYVFFSEWDEFKERRYVDWLDLKYREPRRLKRWHVVIACVLVVGAVILWSHCNPCGVGHGIASLCAVRN